MVGVAGIEPATSSLSGTRSNQLSYTPGCVGGGNGTRTRDIQLAKLALYQLSYAPGRIDPFVRGCAKRRPVFSGAFTRPLRGRSGMTGTNPQPVPVVSDPSRRCRRGGTPSPSRETDCPYPASVRFHGGRRILLRKEVIQPLVPQRLPCYDFIPVTHRTFGVYPPCGSS